MNNPLVSIIVITYNSGKYVLETLESVKDQIYKNVELIISDDRSSDDTIEICKTWLNKNKHKFVRTLLLISEDNTGIPANCNRGIKASHGEWIKLIAGDDAMIFNCIQIYLDYVKENPFAEVLHGECVRYNSLFDDANRLPDNNSAGFKINQPEITAGDQFQILLRTNKVWAGSLMIKRSVFEKVGYYDERIRLWEDRPMLLKITACGIKLHFVNQEVCKYRWHSNSIQFSGQKVNEFVLLKGRYYLDNYLQFLPVYERILAYILIKRTLILKGFNLDKHKQIIKTYLEITSFPWAIILKRLRRKYY